jgi:hypothetical protein
MNIKLITAFLLILLLSGCAETGGVKYYWGDYSDTLYSLKKDPTPETELRHIEELQDIIEVSTETGFKVPPGVQAELGYRYAQKGEMEQTRGLFNSELTTYPESKFFIERLQEMLEE